MPAEVIDSGPQRTVSRYDGSAAARKPVLLVPPLAAPAHLLRPAARLLAGRAPRVRPAAARTCSSTATSSSPTASSGSSTGSRRSSPTAVRAASADAGDRPVRVIGWCLGGIIALLAHAYDRELPIEAAALVASPWDFSKVPLVAPLRPIAAVTRGHGVTQLYRVLGGAPAPLVKRGYQLAGIDKYVMKPWTVVSNLDDRDLLAQIEAVDALHGPHARLSRAHLRPALPPLLPHQRPGRRAARADRHDDRPRRRARSRCWRSPAAATGSRRSPPATTWPTSCRTRRSQLETAPGGHLGVLTGRAARDTTWKRLDAFLDARRLASAPAA